MTMRSFTRQLNLYQRYHTKRLTKITYYIGMPVLIFAFLIFLGWFHLSLPKFFEVNLAWVATIACIIYYFFLDARTAAGVSVLLLLLTFCSQYYSQPQIDGMGIVICGAFALFGIVLIAIGHFSEKFKPSFEESIYLGIIAPMYLFTELMFALGYRNDLRRKIELGR